MTTVSFLGVGLLSHVIKDTLLKTLSITSQEDHLQWSTAFQAFVGATHKAIGT